MLFYDFEVFQHDWLVVIKNTDNRSTTVVHNNSDQLKDFYEKYKDEIWCGYNSRHYDQYIFKAILCDFNPKEVNDHIIIEKQGGWKFSRLFMKIRLNNFDVMSSFHGLKQLEGFMGSNIKETSVPFTINRALTESEIEEVIDYCTHDVEQTMEVFLNRLEEFESHMGLIKMFQLPLRYIGKTKAQITAAILNAAKIKRDDEFDITFPNTLQIEKYKHVMEWYQDNLDYDKKLETDVAGVPHVFGWGGIHGARNNYHGKGIFINVDVSSYYPALMLEYNFLSRNVADTSKFREIRDLRIQYKKEKNPMQKPLKIVLNSTFGASKDKYNGLYDPRQANNVCVGGQLLLLDLIEHLEGHCEIIQSNTDGVLVKVQRRRHVERVKAICKEWEERTRMTLDYEEFTGVWQKDVNNYIVVSEDGTYKSKGAYVKKLNDLDYDLPIVNKAVVENLINNTPVEDTILQSDKLRDFQMIRKVSNKYLYALHGNEKLSEKVLRVFASRRRRDPGVFKVKQMEDHESVQKIANTPERCFLDNGEVIDKTVPRKLDRTWYIDIAKKRIDDFLEMS